jgi:hypothetical protein
VDNFVDNPPLTGAEARVDAGSERVPKSGAKIYLFKINDLENTKNG